MSPNAVIKQATIALLACVGPWSAAVHAQQPRDIQPEAMQAMRDVGAKLRSLQGFSLDVDVRTRAALGAGRYRDFAGTVGYLVRPPRHLFADVRGDGVARRFFYDGTTLVVEEPARQRFARIDAPGSLQTLLERIRASQGVELPIAEMFTWGTAGTPMTAATRARYEGTGMIRSRPCRHYSYLENDLAWEIWVDQSNLTCKVVMVDTADRGLPGYSAVLQWHADRQPPDSGFVFVPSEGAREVTLAQLVQSDETAAP